MPNQSTQNPSIAATGQSLVAVEIRHGKPMVSSLTIAELFSRRHDKVLARVREIDLPVIWEVYQDSYGRDQMMFYAAEREALIMMPYLGGRKSLEGQTKLVDAYLAYHHKAESRKEPEWQQVRTQAILGFKYQNDTLKDVRDAKGKATLPHHYMTEAKLINYVLTGKFAGIDRNTLSAGDLAMIADLQRINAMLISQDVPYKERKAALMDRAIKKLAA